MKYALIDGEIHRHDNEANAYLPLSLAEAQHVVDVMNTVDQTPALKKLVAEFAAVDEEYATGLTIEGTPV